MAILIDTQVLVELERSGRTLDQFLSHFAEEEPVAIAAITASELLLGVYRADSPARRTSRQEFVEIAIERLDLLPFDLAAARKHAALWSELAASGQIIGANDMLIAATALANGYALLTENVREFSRVPGLEVRSLPW